ncbi:Chaperone protein DnaJ, partial [termite gut metagenome]
MFSDSALFEFKKNCDALKIDPRREVTFEVINKIYRDLARVYHPDANPGKDTSQQMKEINIAIGFFKAKKQNLHMLFQAFGARYGKAKAAPVP